MPWAPKKYECARLRSKFENFASCLGYGTGHRAVRRYGSQMIDVAAPPIISRHDSECTVQCHACGSLQRGGRGRRLTFGKCLLCHG